MAAPTPSDRTYISELPANCDEAQTKAVFGAYGTIKSCVFLAQKRAAIIQFESTEEAKWVVDNLNGNIAQGLNTPCKVEFAGSQLNTPLKGAAKGAWNAGAAGAASAAGGWGAQEKGSKVAQQSHPYGGKAAGYSKPALGNAGEQQKGGSWGPQKGGWGQEAQKGGSWTPKGGKEAQKGGSWSPSGDKDDGWGQKGGWGAGKEGGEQQQKGSWSDKGSCGDKGGKGFGVGKKGGGTRGLKKGLQEAGVLPGGKWSNDENALFVGGLPSDFTDLDLYMVFSPFGAIPYRGVRAMTHPDGMCKGFGFVNFLSSEAAQNAINTLNGLEPSEGCTLQVMIKAPAGPVGKDESKGEAKGDGKGEAKGKGKGGW